MCFSAGCFFFFFFNTQAGAQLLFSPRFTDVSEKVFALCNWSLQPGGPSRSLPALVRAKRRVEFWPHSWFSVSTPECNLTFHTSPACSADVWSARPLFSRPSGCSSQRLTSFQTNNLSVGSFCFQMLGTC